MKIRKANINDLNKVYKLFKELIPTKFSGEYSKNTLEYFTNKDFSKSVFKKWLRKRKNTIYLYVVDNIPVSFLIVGAAYGGTSYGHWLAVRKEYQGKGIASKLLNRWEKDAKEKGCHVLHLITENRNINFYKKRGFTLMGMIPQNYFGADDYYFYKKIAQPKEENYLRDYIRHLTR